MRSVLTHADTRSRKPHRVSATVIAAAQACGLHEIIMRLPERYKTVVGPSTVTPGMQEDAEGVCTNRAGHAETLGQLQPPGTDVKSDFHRSECQKDAHLDASSKRIRHSDIVDQDQILGHIRQEAGLSKPQEVNTIPALPPRVIDAVERQLLAIARINYLTLRAQKRSRRVHGVWKTKYAQRPLGSVPDFSAAHAAASEWHVHRKFRAIQRGVTIPEEFKAQRAANSAAAARIDQQQLDDIWCKQESKVLQVHGGIACDVQARNSDGFERVRFCLV
jgi:hypothetical protein